MDPYFSKTKDDEPSLTGSETVLFIDIDHIADKHC